MLFFKYGGVAKSVLDLLIDKYTENEMRLDVRPVTMGFLIEHETSTQLNLLLRLPPAIKGKDTLLHNGSIFLGQTLQP